jgi:hypothetical protein
MGPEIGTCIGIDASVVWMSSSVLEMDDNRRRVMYDGFNSVTLGHSKEWVRVAK